MEKYITWQALYQANWFSRCKLFNRIETGFRGDEGRKKKMGIEMEVGGRKGGKAARRVRKERGER